MKRRDLLGALAAAPFLAGLARGLAAAPTVHTPGKTVSRVRPGDPEWPSVTQWQELFRATKGKLTEVRSPLLLCRNASDTASCGGVFEELKNPYYIGDNVGLTQTTGWVDAWTFQPSVYAVSAATTTDVVAAVNFARQHNLRLVVKGGGHSYLGRSNARDSLLIWTRHMNSVVMHDHFVSQGEGRQAPQPAVSVGAGAIWGHTYNEVTTKGGRYVQGGGCLTVGVAGLVQAGGFGSFSKEFGTAAANLLEAEVVTADGAVRIANAATNPDLLWALKGGGGGSFGIVTRLTLRTHEVPSQAGVVHATIIAQSSDAYRRFIDQFVAFYASRLLNSHWGEIVTLRPGNRADIRMSFRGLSREQAGSIWQPFLDWAAASSRDFAFTDGPLIVAIPGRNLWDPRFLRQHFPEVVRVDDRPGASEENIFWAGNLAEAGHFIYGYDSLWLPSALLGAGRQNELADALFLASRNRSVELHFQKGLAGGSDAALGRTRGTPTNPKVLDAFALVIIGGEGPPAYPDILNHEPDLTAARKEASLVAAAMGHLRKLAPNGGSYFAESNFFEADWQAAYWDQNYSQLLAIKKKYDPGDLFFVHHGVGSESWSADGFSRLTGK
jgi:FAD/FMN-containing dehydrogenase